MIAALLVLAVSGFAQTVRISGTVKDEDGRGIGEVRVRLGKANLATWTGADGSFTLAGSGIDFPYLIGDDRVVFNLEKPVEVRVENLDSSGTVVVSHGEVVSAEDRSITLPHFSSGTHTYRIAIEDKAYAFKSPSGAVSNDGKARIDDALLFWKAGYQLSRVPLTIPDTIGVNIKMAPLVTGTLWDVDGNTYRTVRFGHQEWAVENLKTTRYNDGTPITYVPDSASWLKIYATGSTTSAYGIYGSDSPRQAKYGLFYNWYAVHTGKLAPKGWRVPTDADWDTLQNYLITNGYNYDGTTAGNRIAKAMAAGPDWCSSTLEGAIGNGKDDNNSSGFSSLPGGLRHWGGSYYSLFEERILTYLWSSTEYDSVRAWHRYLDCNKAFFDRLFHHKNTGFPVRVVRDVH